jgi:hypothetical protein
MRTNTSIDRAGRSPRLRWLVVAGLIIIGVGVFWYRDTRHTSIVSVAPEHPELVGLRVGSFRGVHLGEDTRAVVRTLGKPVKWGDFPTPTDASEGATPPSGPGEAISLDYADIAIDTKAGRVVWIVTISPRAQTSRGVGVGDSLALARRAYPHLTCASHDSGVDEAFGPPFCYAHMRPGVNIELIGDPILAIVVHGTRPRPD